MRQVVRGRAARALLSGLVLCCGWQSGRTAEPERVRFDSFDQVELHGTYYPGDLGNKSPCALVLHALGGSSQEEGWINLAKELQNKHFAVLLFDFRGHGASSFDELVINRDFRGRVTGLDAQELVYGLPGAWQKNGLLATNGQLHSQALKIIGEQKTDRG